MDGHDAKLRKRARQIVADLAHAHADDELAGKVMMQDWEAGAGWAEYDEAEPAVREWVQQIVESEGFPIRTVGIDREGRLMLTVEEAVVAAAAALERRGG